MKTLFASLSVALVSVVMTATHAAGQRHPETTALEVRTREVHVHYFSRVGRTGAPLPSPAEQWAMVARCDVRSDGKVRCSPASPATLPRRDPTVARLRACFRLAARHPTSAQRAALTQIATNAGTTFPEPFVASFGPDQALVILALRSHERAPVLGRRRRCPRGVRDCNMQPAPVVGYRNVVRRSVAWGYVGRSSVWNEALPYPEREATLHLVDLAAPGAHPSLLSDARQIAFDAQRLGVIETRSPDALARYVASLDLAVLAFARGDDAQAARHLASASREQAAALHHVPARDRSALLSVRHEIDERARLGTATDPCAPAAPPTRRTRR